MIKFLSGSSVSEAESVQFADVGFKVGGNTGIKYFVLQVHYNRPVENDYSGVSIESTIEPLGKRASILLMVTGGKLPANKRGTSIDNVPFLNVKEYDEVLSNCKIAFPHI